MDYKEFEYINFISHIRIEKSEDKKHLVFKWNKDNQRESEIVDKYKDMSPEEFDKHWFSCLEQYKYKQQQRAPIIAEFKALKPTDFREMPNSQKFKYLDALAIDKRLNKEWKQDFSGIEDNLKACLFSIKADKNFWIKEKTLVNRFISGLIGKNLVEKIVSANKRTSAEKKEDIDKFVSLFCKVYEAPKPEIIFRNPQEHEPDCEASPDGSHIRLMEDFLNKEMMFSDYPIIFHEMIHVHQTVLYKEDPGKYKMFTHEYNSKLRFGIWMAYQGSVEEKYAKLQEIYPLLPLERHAYGMQITFCDLCSDRFKDIKMKYALGGLDFSSIAFGWTRD